MTEKLWTLIQVFWRCEHRRYLTVGAFNTLCGYLVGVATFALLSPIVTVGVIGGLGFLLSTSISFFTLRTFVFRRTGAWFRALVKSYVSYGVIGAVGTGLLWLALVKWDLSIWLAQAIATAVPAVALYFSNRFFVFSRSNEKP